MKILTVVGARPQFIKSAIVSRAIATQESCVEVLLHTGQHFDENMSKVFFDELEIPSPTYHLGIGGGSHGQNTGRMLEAIETVIKNERPSAVLVYGDTDSTLAGALAAVKLGVPVIHIEAGLRSFNKNMPEEINRQLTDHISDLLFTPNDNAIQNLKREGIIESVHNIGDVMFDAALYYGKRANERSQIFERIKIPRESYILATIHRQENTDNRSRLNNILNAFANASRPVVWPLHPRTRSRMTEYDLAIPKNVLIIEPIGYIDMVMLEQNASLIATDSGGVQKEAYFHGVPCLTLRDETEWTELVDAGWNRLISPDSGALAESLQQDYAEGSKSFWLYGDGNAADKAVAWMIKTYS